MQEGEASVGVVGGCVDPTGYVPPTDSVPFTGHQRGSSESPISLTLSKFGDFRFRWITVIFRAQRISDNSNEPNEEFKGELFWVDVRTSRIPFSVYR